MKLIAIFNRKCPAFAAGIGTFSLLHKDVAQVLMRWVDIPWSP
jgi:hypothetical protein